MIRRYFYIFSATLFILVTSTTGIKAHVKNKHLEALSRLKNSPPDGFNYQAVLRDDEGELLANNFVSIRFTLHNGSSDVWVESHGVTTNAYGMINLVIGTGIREGGIAANFASIDWSDEVSVQVEADTGGGYVVLGNSVLQSVPYAQYAANGLTNEQSTKLTDIEEAAQVNVQADWDEVDTSSDAFVRNKPTIPKDINELTDTNSLIPNDLNQLADSDGLLNGLDFSGSYDDLTDQPDIPSDISDLSDNNNLIPNDINELSDADGLLAGSLFDGSFNSLTDIPADLDTDQTDDFSGSYDDLSNQPTIPTDISQLADSNGLIPLDINELNDEDGLLAGSTFDGSFNSLTDVPDNLDTDQTDDFSGNYSDLTDAPTIPSDIDDLTDTNGRIPTDVGDLTDTGDLIPSDISDLTDNSSSIPSDIDDLTDTNNLLFSRDYDDLTNTPTIPLDVDDLSDTNGRIPADVGDLTDTGNLIPSDLSDLTDNSSSIPSDIDDLTDTNNLLFSRDYDDLTNTPTIPLDVDDLSDTNGRIPTDVGDLTDTGDLIPSDISDLTDNSSSIPSDIDDLTDTNNLLFSGDYDDLTDVPNDLLTTADLIFSESSNVISAGDSNDDFVFGSNQLDDSNDSNHDTRFFFDKTKGAFRAGTATADEWDEDNLGDHSFAAGTATQASGAYSTVSGGSGNVAGTSFYSNNYFSNYTMGTGSTVGGGLDNSALGDYSTVSGGINNQAGSYYSSSINSQDYEYGFGGSIGGGRDNKAYGNFSTIPGGKGLETSSYAATIIGHFNKSTDGSYASPVYSDPLFVIGNGSEFVRNDALVIERTGNTDLYGALDVHGALHVGGNITYTGTISQSSDRRLKKDIFEINEPVLTTLSKLETYRYKYNGIKTKDTISVHIGVMAQELQKLFPELVKEGKDGYLSVQYTEMIPLLVEAIKELAGQNQALKEAKASNEERLTSLEAKIDRLLGTSESTSTNAK